MNIDAIRERLPHRYPFLLVDRVLELDPGKSIQAIKNVTINELFFQGHFPKKPIMPGMLIIEALAQAAGLMMYDSYESVAQKGGVFYLAGLDRVKFRRIVTPGDQLVLDVTLKQQRNLSFRCESTAKVDDRVVCQAILLCMTQ